MDKEHEEKIKKLEREALKGASAEVVQRYGSAVKQHYVAYSGMDNETGQRLAKGLKDIAKSKINPEYRNQNIKQQAGFAAEVKSVARKNADNIINGKPNRITRTDDIGRVNDPLYDLVERAPDGTIIPGTASQMKFVGNSPEELLNKLNSKKYEKYIDAKAILDIADDDYEALIGINGNKGIIDEKIAELKTQAEHAKDIGKSEVAEQKLSQIEKYEYIKKKLRKSGLTKGESVEARLYAKWSTAKDTMKIAHDAGIEQSIIGVKISGAISLVRNTVACFKGEKTPEEAAVAVVADTGTGMVVSYTTAFSGSVIKGAMQNSSNEYIKGLSKSNLAAGLVTTTMNVGRTFRRYFDGDITGAKCVEELGEQGVGEIGSAMFSAMGASFAESAAVTASKSTAKLLGVVGGVAGATLGYAAAVACYQEIATALKEAELAREERIRIEQECEKAIALIRQYRQEMNIMVSEYMTEHIQTFNQGFLEMDKAIMECDVNGFIRGNARIQECLGKEVQFRSQEEFDELMLSDTAFRF
ncbi:MAG: hypothetical protein NC419_00530 [Muribaculaceae bacterium]|nr:hypothetical protein [Muribaculaceae bacterium]